MRRYTTNSRTILRILFAIGAGFLIFASATRARRDADVGIDSYYYQAQARSLRETGTFHYPRSYSVAAPLLVAAIGRFEDSDEQALRDAVVVAVATLLLTVCLAAYHIGHSRLSVAFAATAVASAGALRFFVVEYLSQLLALSLFAAVVACVLQAERDRRRRRRYVSAIVMLVAVSPLVHPSGAILAILFIVAYAAIRWAEVYPRRALQTVAVAIPLITFSIMAARAAARMSPFAARVLAEMKATPLPVLSGAFAADAIALAVCGGAWLAVRHGASIELRRPVDALFLTGAAVGLNPWANYLTNLGGVLSRLALDTFVFPALGGSAVIAVGVRTRPGLVSAVAIAIFALLAMPRFVPGESHAFVESRRELRLLAAGLKARLPAGAALIAQHGDQFLLTYVLRVESASRRRTVHAPDDRVWWVLRNPSNSCDLRQVSLLSTGNLSVLANARLLEIQHRTPLTWHCILASNPHQRFAGLD